MAVTVIDCLDCGTHTDRWVEQRDAPVCFDCNAKRAARVVLADELATGRAAVRALWQTHVWKHGGDAAFAERCDSPLCQDITAVLATDTARAWLREGQK